jgi:hypothetical protein
MAKTDRDPNYMKEVFGTTSLITDYVSPEPSATVESVLKDLKSEYDLTMEPGVYYDTYEYNRGFIDGIKMVIDKLEQLGEQK